MSITIVIGPYRQQALFNQLYGRDRQRKERGERPNLVALKELVAIPNLHCHPTLARMVIDSYRGAGELLHEDLDIIITTECAAVIDVAIPCEVLIAQFEHIPFEQQRLHILPGFMAKYAAGVQHLSELLLTNGLWQLET